MDRYAVVDTSGTVQNVVICNADFDPGEGLQIVQVEGANRGDRIVSGKLIPAPQVSKPVTAKDLMHELTIDRVADAILNADGKAWLQAHMKKITDAKAVE